MAKKNVILVRMTSTGLREDGTPTDYYYVRRKNAKAAKLSLKKYDPRAFNKETGKIGLHVVFNEKKMPNPKA